MPTSKPACVAVRCQRSIYVERRAGRAKAPIWAIIWAITMAAAYREVPGAGLMFSIMRRSMSPILRSLLVHRRGLSADRRRCRCQPLRRPGIDKRGNRLAHPRVIGIEPGDLAVVEQVAIDQGAVDRRQGQRLETERLALAATFFRPDDDEVLDADAVSVGLVIAGFIRHDHAGQQGLCVRRLRDALRPLMHRQITADPVPGAVVVIETLFP